ncbi:TPA: hypothetical protein ACX3BB_001258 [Pasteurella multocida]
MSARGRKRLEQEAEQALTNQKLDEILSLTREVNRKIDRLDDRVDDIDTRLEMLETRMDKLGIKSVMAGGLGGLVVSVGFELIKAKFGG